MSAISKQLEAKFMNELPFSMRAAAIDVYRLRTLKEVLEIRIGQIPENLVQQYHFSTDQWRQIGNAVALTKCSQLHLSNHLTANCFQHLHKVVASALNTPQASLDEIYQAIQVGAPNLAIWVRQLNKLLKPL